MVFEVCVLGSGSSGNATLIRAGEDVMLVDAGFSCREITRRLASVGVLPESIKGICVSHEHADHISGLFQMQKQYGIPLFANSGTAEAVHLRQKSGTCRWHVFHNGSPFGVGAMNVLPFSVPHDAYDPVGFVVAVDNMRVGIVTDAGTPTALMRQRLSTCQIVIIESNHDEEMVKEAERPWTLKQRILGRQGHLSNVQSADMLAEFAGPQLQHVFLVHLSDECNTPEKAFETHRARLDADGHQHVSLTVSPQGEPTEFRACEIPVAMEA